MNLRKIDALIFKNIFDKPVCDKPMSADLPDKCSLFHVAEHFAPDEPLIPHYSTDISAAWEVVEKLGDVKLKRSLYNCTTDKENKWEAFCTVHDEYGLMGYGAMADTAALAICLLALKAKGIEV
jgi:hypothetical protein